MMDELMVFFMVAVLVEQITEYIKALTGEGIPEKLGHLDTFMLISLAVGLGLAVMLEIDLFAPIGIHFNVPYIGMVLTGMILSRGSNYLFDFINKMKKPRTEK